MATELGSNSSARVCEELRAFRIAGARGFERTTVPTLRNIAQAIMDPHPIADETIDDVLVAAVAFCLAAEVRGPRRTAVRVHLGLQPVPVEVAARLGIAAAAPELGSHKNRAAAAALIASYSKDHYAEAVLRPTMQRVADRLTTAPPSLSDLGLAPQPRGDRSPFTVASHQFIPVWLGKERAQAFTIAYKTGQCMTRGLLCTQLALGHHRGRPLLFDFGVLVVHVREELSFETITSLAQWRRRAYRNIMDEIGDLVEARCGAASLYGPVPTPSHVLSLYYVLQRGWPQHEERSAIALLAMPSVLLERPDRDNRGAANRVYNEAAYLESGFDSPELHQFGMPQVAQGYAAWSGVAYAPLDDARALSEADLVELEIATQAAWCYADVVADSTAAARASSDAEHHAVRRSITRVGAQENTQLCLAREAIVVTSRVEDLLVAAHDSIMVAERNI